LGETSAVRTPEMARRRPLLLVAAVVLLCAAEWHVVQAYKKASKMISPTISFILRASNALILQRVYRCLLEDLQNNSGL
jgi:hypothetical protein